MWIVHVVIAVYVPFVAHAACFHGDEMVVTDRGVMSMQQLARGVRDEQLQSHGPITVGVESVRVQSVDPIKQTVELVPIIYWLHRLPDTPDTYINLQTQSGARPQLSKLSVQAPRCG